MQLPPSVKLRQAHASNEEVRGFLSPKFKHAIEFRHKSWFTPEVYKLLEKNNVAMTWSLNQYLETPAGDYGRLRLLRMVGERDITEFTGIQKERKEDMERWADEP